MKRPKLPPPVLARVEAVGPPVPVMLDARAIDAWKWLPRVAPVGAILVGPDGTTVKVRDDGSIEDLPPGGHPHPGPAADPCHTAATRVEWQASFPFPQVRP